MDKMIVYLDPRQDWPAPTVGLARRTWPTASELLSGARPGLPRVRHRSA